MNTSLSNPARALVLLTLGTCVALAVGPAVAAGGSTTARGEGACATTSQAARNACIKEAQDDYWIAIGNCANLADAAARPECREDARSELQEASPDCRDQYDARQEVCDALGEGPYAPQYHPSDFVDPLDVGGSVAPNPYLPLVPGTRFTYRNNAAGEQNVVSVTRDTIEIDGVTCIVVHDVVSEPASGDTIEDTDDYFAQDVHGNVWYFGEVSREYEDGFLVSLDGSWRAGIDDAKAGILMKAAPQVGDVYRQEFLLGEAEDLARVANLSGSGSSPYASCGGTCLVTKEFTPLEPDALERKYYKPGLGLILIVNAGSGEREALVAVETF